MKAILLVDHGSVREAANQMLECVGHLVQRMAGERVIVRIAHMELAEPTIAQGIDACVQAGATEIAAFPYMLSPGKHSTRDIPRLVAEAAARYPHIAVTVTPAFGVHDKLAEVVLERAGLSPARAPAAPARACVRPEGAPEGHCGDACRSQMSVAGKA
ncbi:MAG TPA: CbiX/SirB N-terminal domain-containing protein [Gemmatimonadaceae bacterium]